MRLTVVIAVMLASAVSVLADSSSPAIMVFGNRGSGAVPGYRVLSSGGTFGAQASLPSALGQCSWIRVENDPGRNQTLGVFMEDTRALRYAYFDGTSWSTPVSLTTLSGENMQYRAFDMVCANNGKYLIAYWDDATSTLRYITLEGAAGVNQTSGFVGALPASVFGSTTLKVRWVALRSRPCDNRAVLTALDTDGRLFASVWSGSGWGAFTQLSSTPSSSVYECFAGVVQGQSGTPMVIYGKNDGTVVSRLFSSGTWQNEIAVPWPSTSLVNWMRATTRASDDTVLLAGSDTSAIIRTNTWNGTAWLASGSTLSGAMTNAGRPQHDVRFTSDGTRAMLLYNVSGSGSVMYKNYDGTTWSAAASASGGSQTWGAGALYWGLAATDLWGLWVPTGSRFFSVGFNGTAVSQSTVQQSGLITGGQATLAFSLAVPRSTIASCASASTYVIDSWRQVEPTSP